MPLISITTNQPMEEQISQNLLQQVSGAVADMLSKPERYVMACIKHNPNMIFGASDAPLAYLELKSIGLPGDSTADFSKALSDLIGNLLEIPPDRVYIEFSDAERHLWGWNGTTF